MPNPIQYSRILGVKFAEDLKGLMRSKSQNLFTKMGLMKVNSGFIAYSPFLLRALRKLERLVHTKMEEVGALEIQLPSISEFRWLRYSGRQNLPDIFTIDDENKKFYLNPTCEEAISHLMSKSFETTHKHLPCRLYQITNKFRDEKRPKFGLLRAREFTMKDLYCFDTDELACQRTYQEIKAKYHEFFREIEIPFECVKGDTENFGGKLSHEFHYLTDIGENIIVECKNCGYKGNVTNVPGRTSDVCIKCESKNVGISKGIEVGHIFNLGTKYTEAFNAYYLSLKGSKRILHMSCYGLGLSRILAATTEIMSTENELRWPKKIVPFLLCILQPKDNSMEYETGMRIINSVTCNLKDILDGDILIDDRVNLTYRKRMTFIEALGIPYTLIMRKEACDTEPTAEVHDLYTNELDHVPLHEIEIFLRDKILGRPARSRMRARRSERARPSSW